MYPLPRRTSEPGHPIWLNVSHAPYPVNSPSGLGYGLPSSYSEIPVSVPDMTPAFPTSDIATPTHSHSSNSDDQPQPSPPPRRSNKRRRVGTPPAEDTRAKCIGSVMDNGKFICSYEECQDGTTFGRLADLRRHNEHIHTGKRKEYFCTYNSCKRSNKNTGGSGRGFGSRRDKRDEHIRTVHEKSGKKRRAPDSDDDK